MIFSLKSWFSSELGGGIFSLYRKHERISIRSLAVEFLNVAAIEIITDQMTSKKGSKVINNTHSTEHNG